MRGVQGVLGEIKSTIDREARMWLKGEVMKKEKKEDVWDKVRDVVVCFGQERILICYSQNHAPWELPLVTYIHCYLDQDVQRSTH